MPAAFAQGERPVSLRWASRLLISTIVCSRKNKTSKGPHRNIIFGKSTEAGKQCFQGMRKAASRSLVSAMKSQDVGIDFEECPAKSKAETFLNVIGCSVKKSKHLKA